MKTNSAVFTVIFAVEVFFTLKLKQRLKLYYQDVETAREARNFNVERQKNKHKQIIPFIPAIVMNLLTLCRICVCCLCIVYELRRATLLAYSSATQLPASSTGAFLCCDVTVFVVNSSRYFTGPTWQQHTLFRAKPQFCYWVISKSVFAFKHKNCFQT